LNGLRRCGHLLKDRFHVHASVLRSVGPEAAGGLLELPLAADAVAAAGLVPRHREVDEALEEVPLLGLGGTPGVFELLVGGEVLAPADQIEAGCELLRFRF
jgi:hypothetical protein